MTRFPFRFVPDLAEARDSLGAAIVFGAPRSGKSFLGPRQLRDASPAPVSRPIVQAEVSTAPPLGRADAGKRDRRVPVRSRPGSTAGAPE